MTWLELSRGNIKANRLLTIWCNVLDCMHTLGGNIMTNAKDDYPQVAQPNPGTIPCTACRQTGLDAYPPIGMECRVCHGKGWLTPTVLRKLFRKLWERWALMRRSQAPWCCYSGCARQAEFSIYGSSGHFEDVTETCERHVGSLLGTPQWLKKDNKSWTVSIL